MMVCDPNSPDTNRYHEGTSPMPRRRRKETIPLERLATDAGIATQEIAAVGDDWNDVEMIRRAGLGIAMGNAVDPAKAAATIVVRSNAEGGVVEALERVLLHD